MSTTVEIILIAYCAVAVFCALIYSPKLRQFFSMFYRPPHKLAETKRKISLVVPARNESAVIGDLLASIETQTYDREFFDVNVIVNDENDPTVELAKAAGANVFVVKKQECKGDALDGYFKALKKDKFKDYAAFVIVDADAVLTPNYIEELNNALEHDFQIYLSRKYIKNYIGNKKSRTLHCNCSALTYPQLDDLCNNYRTRHGIPLNMCGQGMMIRRDVIEQLKGWPYRTLTEDYELRMDCFLKGFTSMYYPYAILYTEETATHKASYKRRLRWLTGFSQCSRKYKKKIKQQARERGRMTEGEFEYFFSIIPAIIFLVATWLCAGAGVGLSVYYAFSGYRWLYVVLILIVFPCGLAYLVTFAFALLCMIAYRDALKPLSFWRKALTLLYAPFFMLEYLPIFIHSRFTSLRKQCWEPTEHLSAEDEEETDEPAEDGAL